MRVVVGPRTLLDRPLFTMLCDTGQGWMLDLRAVELGAIIAGNDEEIPAGAPRIEVRTNRDEIMRRNYVA